MFVHNICLCSTQGGETVYFGPARDTMAYFAGLGYDCPVHENPADHFGKKWIVQHDQQAGCLSPDVCAFVVYCVK